MEDKVEAKMLIDFEEESTRTIVPLISRLINYAFTYGYTLGLKDQEKQLESTMGEED
jgi:hypothetical protein